MIVSERRLILLGPQRVHVTAGTAVQEVAGDHPVATITAGWHEREQEDRELNEVLRGQSRNLALNDRAERVWRSDPELRAASRILQSRLRLLRRAYGLQLASRMEAWAALEELEGDNVVLDPERAEAFEFVRRLDARHLSRVLELRQEFVHAMRPLERTAVERERHEISAILKDTAAVAIAGGHIAVLLNRCRMFGIGDLLGNQPVVAWSGGAMAVSEHVVLFHDSPPQGFGHSEAFDQGLGFARGIVALPHAADRLRLDDARRVGLLVRRFSPAMCLPLDGGEGVTLQNGTWEPYGRARRMRPDGVVEPLAA